MDEIIKLWWNQLDLFTFVRTRTCNAMSLIVRWFKSRTISWAIEEWIEGKVIRIFSLCRALEQWRVELFLHFCGLLMLKINTRLEFFRISLDIVYVCHHVNRWHSLVNTLNRHSSLQINLDFRVRIDIAVFDFAVSRFCLTRPGIPLVWCMIGSLWRNPIDARC